MSLAKIALCGAVLALCGLGAYVGWHGYRKGWKTLTAPEARFVARRQSKTIDAEWAEINRRANK